MVPSRNSPLSGASIRIRNRTWLQGTIVVGLASYAVATVLQAATSGLAALSRLTEPWGCWLRHRARPDAAGHLTAGTVLALAVAWIEMVADMLFTPWGIRSAATPTLPLVVLAAGMVAGPWGSRVVAGFTALWVPLALLFGHHVLGRGPGIPVADLIALATFEIALLGSAIGLELVLRTFGEVLQVARDNERRATELLEASPDAIVGIAPEGGVEAFNREAARVFGCPRAAVLGRPASALAIRSLDGEQPLAWDAVGGEGRPGEVIAADTGLRLEVNARDVEREDGRRGRILTLRDVTERRAAEEHARRLEQHVRDAQKLESLGLLAGGIAHDFNNLLTVVGGYAALLAEAGDPEVQKLSREVLAAQRRGALLTRQLLTFARRDVAQPEPLDLGALLLDVGKLVARWSGSRWRSISTRAPPAR
jgi:PAS domain S-box-containing protein